MNSDYVKRQDVETALSEIEGLRSDMASKANTPWRGGYIKAMDKAIDELERILAASK